MARLIWGNIHFAQGGSYFEFEAELSALLPGVKPSGRTPGVSVILKFVVGRS